MAKSSAKNLIRANKARLARLRQIVGLTNLLYAAVRMGVRRTSFDQTAQALWALCLILYGGPYLFLAWAARPTMSSDGKSAVDGGSDLAAAGVAEYAHDFIYFTALAQIGCIFSPYAMLGMLVVPGFAAYKLFALCCGNRGGGDEGGEEVAQEPFAGSGISRKERRKASRAKAN